jgi:ribose transport system ATP-binding protein
VIAELKARGAAILYVSHRMAEVVEIADRVTVLRDGEVALSCPMAETSKDGIIAAMTGQDVADAYPQAAAGHRAGAGEGAGGRRPVRGAGPRCGFQPRRGEILGIAGLEGAGQSEILRALPGRSAAGAGRMSGWAANRATRSAAEGWAAASPMSRASGGARG